MRIADTAKLEAYKSQTKVENHKHNSSKVQTNDPNSDEANKSIKHLEEPKDQIDISILKEEADKAHAHLRQIVEDLLKRQGIEIDKLPDLKAEDIKVDQQARDEAAKMVESGGPLSPEAVSDRIVDFAKSISGGNKDKLDLLRDAIEEGFAQAKEFMGGELPEISSKTYDMIQEKLDAWEEE